MTSHDLTWHKSSYSGGTNGACVEVALPWRKSSYSGATNGDCVEVALNTELVGVRDSKSPTSGHLNVPAESWTAFLRAAQTP